MRGAVTIALSYNQVRHKFLTCYLNYDVWFLDFSLVHSAITVCKFYEEVPRICTNDYQYHNRCSFQHNCKFCVLLI